MIYLDNNATTPVDPEVMQTMIPYFSEVYGNPSSTYYFGQQAEHTVEKARYTLSECLGTNDANRIVFTGNGTEADNLAIKGFARANATRGNHIITTQAEHAAVLNTCAALEQEGFRITYLPVDAHGLLLPETLKGALQSDTILVSVMTANNETGVIQPLENLAALVQPTNACFHTDAIQAFGKIPIHGNCTGIDMISVSAHKLYGPKGIGALYAAPGIELKPLIHGGHQESNLRPGTENVPAIAGFPHAAEKATQRVQEGTEIEKMRVLRDHLEQRITSSLEGVRINGKDAPRLPNTLNVSLSDIEADSLLFALDREGICASAGSACASGALEASHVLTAMGLDETTARSSIRFSLSPWNTQEEIDHTAETVIRIVKEMRERS